MTPPPLKNVNIKRQLYEWKYLTSPLCHIASLVPLPARQLNHLHAKLGLKFTLRSLENWFELSRASITQHLCTDIRSSNWDSGVLGRQCQSYQLCDHRLQVGLGCRLRCWTTSIRRDILVASCIIQTSATRWRAFRVTCSGGLCLWGTLASFQGERESLGRLAARRFGIWWVGLDL